MKNERIDKILNIMENFVNEYDKSTATISFSVVDIQCIYYYVKYLEGISDIAIGYLNRGNSNE